MTQGIEEIVTKTYEVGEKTFRSLEEAEKYVKISKARADGKYVWLMLYTNRWTRPFKAIILSSRISTGVDFCEYLMETGGVQYHNGTHTFSATDSQDDEKAMWAYYNLYGVLESARYKIVSGNFFDGVSYFLSSILDIELAINYVKLIPALKAILDNPLDNPEEEEYDDEED